MLLEWLQYLLTPCSKHLRVMGYPQEVIATQARYRRCKDAWRPHLENTKAAILESAAAAKRHDCAVILGSGVLLDVSLAELSGQFKQVILVDILHLPWVKRHALRYPNVRFHQMDVTDICRLLVEQAKEKSEAPAQLPQVLPKPLTQTLGLASVDFLASVNLLSQLPILPCAYLEKQFPIWGDSEREIFSRALISNHLLWLKASGDQICLISDLKRLTCDASGSVIEEEDALAGIALGPPDRSWHWDIAPAPELHPAHSIRHEVGGYLHLT